MTQFQMTQVGLKTSNFIFYIMNNLSKNDLLNIEFGHYDHQGISLVDYWSLIMKTHHYKGNCKVAAIICKHFNKILLLFVADHRPLPNDSWDLVSYPC